MRSFAVRCEHGVVMREGFGRITYCLAGAAAKAMALFFAVAFFALICADRAYASKQDSAEVFRRSDVCTVAERPAGAGETILRDGNGTFLPDNFTITDSNETEANVTPTEAVEPTPTPKPKKQLAAEQYALGVILAGGIAIGMMVALFFYYTKQNNGGQD